jgi:hypothetical protein
MDESPQVGGRVQRRRARDRVRRRRRAVFLAGLLGIALLVGIVLWTRGSSDGADTAGAPATNSTTVRPATTTSPVTTTPIETTPVTTTPVTTTPPATAPAVTRTELRPGSSGSDVVALQQRLIALGYKPGNPDGTFGAATTEAVKAFQAAKGLPADGIVGQRTWDALNAA